MTVEKGSEWLLPENMKRAASAEEGLYAAHKAYATGEDPTLIQPHAIIDFHYALNYAHGLAAALRRLGIELAGNILDAGCAAGTITGALHQAANAGGECCGIDLSAPLIACAAETFPDCRFSVCSADALGEFEDGYFDIIHAREFYPFTRSASASFHWYFLDCFARKLRPGGAVIAVQIIERRGLADSFGALCAAAHAHGFSKVSRHVMAPNRLYRKIGDFAYSRFLYPAITLATYALEKLSPGWVTYTYVFRT